VKGRGFLQDIILYTFLKVLSEKRGINAGTILGGRGMQLV